MISIYYLNTKDPIQIQTQHFKTLQSVLSRHLIDMIKLKETVEKRKEVLKKEEVLILL